MNYLETLISLEPSLLTNNSKDYGIAYHLPESALKWRCMDHLDLWQVWCICKTCVELGREVRVRHNATQRIVTLRAHVKNAHIRAEERLLLLNLFFNRISDRNGKDTENE